MAISKLDESALANVDLDIYSKEDLRPLVDAFGDQVIEMWVGRVRRTYEAHLETGWEPRRTPSSIILRFCKMIHILSPAARKLWNGAKKKSFDIGIYSPTRSYYYWSALTPEAVRAVAELGAQIAITVYGPMKPTRSAKRRPSNSSK